MFTFRCFAPSLGNLASGRFRRTPLCAIRTKRRFTRFRQTLSQRRFQRTFSHTISSEVSRSLNCGLLIDVPFLLGPTSPIGNAHNGSNNTENAGNQSTKQR